MFLKLRGSNLRTKLCPTYDIDLVWHAHMAMQLRCKADTERVVGLHLPHERLRQRPHARRHPVGLMGQG